MHSWQQDKRWADRHLPEVERIIRSIAGDIITIEVAPDDADQKRATDYVVTVQSGYIACRIRRWQNWIKHHDVTLRCRRPSGVETELSKIRAGYGRWYLYAWSTIDSKFGAWVFIDLDVLRHSGLLEQRRREIANPDGSSWFHGYSLDDLDDAHCLVHAGGEAVTLLQRHRETMRQLALFPT